MGARGTEIEAPPAPAGASGEAEKAEGRPGIPHSPDSWALCGPDARLSAPGQVERPPARPGAGKEGASSPAGLPAQTSPEAGGAGGKDAPPGQGPQESLALAVAAQGGGAVTVTPREEEQAAEAWRSSHPLLPGSSISQSFPFTAAGVCQTQRTWAGLHPVIFQHRSLSGSRLAPGLQTPHPEIYLPALLGSLDKLL